MARLVASKSANMEDVGTITSPVVNALGVNPVLTKTSSSYIIKTDQYITEFYGSFTWGASGDIQSGTIESFIVKDVAGITVTSNSGPWSVSVVSTDTAGTAAITQSVLFEGGDNMQGSEFADTLLGYAGTDTIYGGLGNDLLNAGAEPIADYLYGQEGDDYLAGGGGPDQLYGGIGSDEIRAGHGKDTISGGVGADILYGGGGTNAFLSEADGSIDQLYVMSDFRGHAFDWGRNHGGVNADVITELDANDRITILGTSDSSLTFRPVAAGTFNQSQAGIGIFDGDSLEALYIGSNLNASQLDAITSGDPTRFS